MNPIPPKTASLTRKFVWTCGPFYKDQVEGFDGEPYMVRWACKLPGGRALRLHKILRPDPDRHPHDHPFDMHVWVLWGGYVERLYVRDVLVFGPTPVAPSGQGIEPDFSDSLTIQAARWPSLLPRFVKATDVHQIVKLYRGVSWSVVLAGPRKRTWGFWTKAGFIPYNEYTGDES